MFRISDRYILRAFAYSFVICVLALVSIFIIVDTFDHLPEILRGWRATGRGAAYLPIMVLKMNVAYMPLMFYEFLPMFILSAAMFTVVKLKKSNELTPLLASGVSTYRILWPLFFATIILTAVQVADREILIPRYGEEIFNWERIRTSSSNKYRMKAIMEDDYGNVIFANKYEIAAKTQWGPQFTRYWAAVGASTPMVIINAKQAQWTVRDGKAGWLYSNGTVIRQDPSCVVLSQDSFGEVGYFVPLIYGVKKLPNYQLVTDATPEKLETKEVDIYYKPSLQLLQYAREHGLDVRIALDINRRMAAPFTNFILLLVGLPFVLRRELKSPFLGVLMAIGITLVYFAMGLVCENFAVEGRLLTPLAGAWAPIIIFGPIGVILFDMIES